MIAQFCTAKKAKQNNPSFWYFCKYKNQKCTMFSQFYFFLFSGLTDIMNGS